MSKQSNDRVVNYGNSWKQITIGDTRFYKKEDNFFPSVSFILSSYPKNKQFQNWLKEKGSEADEIVSLASIQGTKIHKAIETLLEGKELIWVEENGFINYSVDEWLMITRFQEFWDVNKPKLIHSEIHIYSDVYKYAGTIDLILEINKELWIVDIKTSNSLHTVYELQTAAYAIAYNEHNDRKIDRTGILWLKSNTRKADKNNKTMRGKGWILKEFDRKYPESFEIFKHVQAIWSIENPNFKPVTEMYVNSVKLILN